MVAEIRLVDFVGMVLAFPLNKESPLDETVSRVTGPLYAVFKPIIEFPRQVVFFEIAKLGIAGRLELPGRNSHTELFELF